MIRSEMPAWAIATIWFSSSVVFGFGFAHAFFNPKWALVYVAAVLVSILALSARGVALGLSKQTLIFFGALAAFVALTSVRLFLLGFDGWNETLTDRLTFLCLTFGLTVLFSTETARKFRPFICASLLICSVVSFAGLNYIFFIEDGSRWHYGFAPLSGNINMTAEIVGLALFPVGLAALMTRRLRFLPLALLCVGLIYIWFSLSRSALLAITVGLTVFAALESRFRPIILKALPMTAAFIVLLSFVYPPRQYGFDSRTAKAESASDRWEIWRETWSMLPDHPAGVGPGQFLFAYLPYKIGGKFAPIEHVIEHSPHNEYLHILVEDGWPGFLLVLAGLTALGWAAIKKYRNAAPGTDARSLATLVLASFSFLSIQSLFQFPFFNAPTVCWVAVLFAVAMAGDGKYLERNSFALPRVVWGTLCLLLVTCAWLGARTTLSYKALGKAQTHYSFEKSCSWAPWNWRACVFMAEREISWGRPEMARQTLRPFLKAQPFNYPALRLWATTSFMTERPDEGCRALFIFDELFEKKSTMHDELENLCEPEVREKLASEKTLEAYLQRKFSFE